MHRPADEIYVRFTTEVLCISSLQCYEIAIHHGSCIKTKCGMELNNFRTDERMNYYVLYNGVFHQMNHTQVGMKAGV